MAKTGWGIAFIAAAALATALFAIHVIAWDRSYILLDQPMRVVANRTITNAFTVPVSAPYAINIYVLSRVSYADCLLGQVEDRCRRHPGVIDVDWRVHARDGSVLRQGESKGTCCTYTSDAYKNAVVFVTIGDFRLNAGTTAYLELRYGPPGVAKLKELAPRVVLNRIDPNWVSKCGRSSV